MAVYALVNYRLTITVPKSLQALFGQTIVIGGKGSFVQTFSVPSRPLYTVQGDATGGYIHEKSINRSGNVSLTLNILAPQVKTLLKFANTYYNQNVSDEAFTMKLTNLQSTTLVTCNACLFADIPQSSFSASAPTQTWNFACGEIIES